MNNQITNTSLLLGGLCLSTTLYAERPNILFILSDDQGFAELGAYGDFADPDILQAKHIEQLRKITEVSRTEAPVEVAVAAARRSTPNIDSLAAEGVRFTSFYAAPTCSPSRAALMTARYPQRYGVYSNDDVEEPLGYGLPVKADILVRHFQENGYRTGMSGKWHLGSDEGQHPNDVGFEYFFGFDRAFTDPYGSEILYRNRTNVPAKGWVEDQISDEAVNFLKEIENDPRPFFLYVAYSVPRDSTLRPPEHYVEAIQSGSEIIDVHFGTIYGMDTGIGRILDQLKASGQFENTLIFFATDNGKAQGPYHHGFRITETQSHLVPIPGNGPLRGCKWTIWDGGVRVPFIARLPGGAQGATSNALQSIMDVLPTAFEFAGIEVEETSHWDGESFLATLNDPSQSNEDRIIFWAADALEPYGDFHEEHQQLRQDFIKKRQHNPHPVRSGNFPATFYVRTVDWKLMGWGDTRPVLVNIQDDISELHDVSEQHPEVTRALSAAFAEWMADLPDPLVFPNSQFDALRRIR